MLHPFALLALVSQLALSTPLRRSENEQCIYQPYQGTAADDAVVHGEYIVHFHSEHSMELHQEHVGYNISATERYRPLPWLPGYKAALDETAFHELVRRDPGVKFAENELIRRAPRTVEENRDWNNTVVEGLGNTLQKRYTSVPVYGAPWDLLVMASAGKLAGLPTDDIPLENEYDMLEDSGSGVNIYVLDGGILLTHDTFGGRATNFQDKTTSKYANDEPMTDVTGHGTLCAGLAGGQGYGVAEAATLVNVKVVRDNGDSFSSDIADAINDIITEHDSLKTTPSTPTDAVWRGSVITNNYGGPGYSDAELQAYENAASAGIPVVVAAGNDNMDAAGEWPCAFSLLDTTSVTCVASVDNNYAKPPKSNYGEAVTLAAPGYNVWGPDYQNDEDAACRRGTSYASPLVAGVMANFVYWEALNADITATQTLAARLLSNSYDNLLNGFPNNQPSRIANTGLNNADAKAAGVPYVDAPSEPAIANAAAVLAALEGASTAVVGQATAVAAAEVLEFATLTGHPTLASVVTVTPSWTAILNTEAQVSYSVSIAGASLKVAPVVGETFLTQVTSIAGPTTPVAATAS